MGKRTVRRHAGHGPHPADGDRPFAARLSVAQEVTTDPRLPGAIDGSPLPAGERLTSVPRTRLMVTIGFTPPDTSRVSAVTVVVELSCDCLPL